MEMGETNWRKEVGEFSRVLLHHGLDRAKALVESGNLPKDKVVFFLADVYTETCLQAVSDLGWVVPEPYVFVKTIQSRHKRLLNQILMAFHEKFKERVNKTGQNIKRIYAPGRRG